MTNPPFSNLPPPLPDTAADAVHIPPAERTIDAPLIERLVAEQFPALQHRRARIVGEGWDNVMARLEKRGSDDGFGEVAARLPRRHLGVNLLRNEQRWLPQLAPLLPLPIPTPLFCGEPSEAFDWPWSIVPWLEGTTADKSPPNAEQVGVYCAFFSALHRPAPLGAPDNPVRSCSLAEKSPNVEERFTRLQKEIDRAAPILTAAGIVDVNEAMQRWRHLWDEGVRAPLPTRKTWIAGDVHPRNVICDEVGTLVGFIDFGDLTVGDRCTDLASLWGLFPSASARAQAIAQLDLDANERIRLKAWAVFYGVTLVQTGLGIDAEQVEIGARLLARLDLDVSGT